MLDSVLHLMETNKRWLMGGLLLLALLFPFLAPNKYFIHVVSLALIMAIAASGLNLLVGYTGQFNLAHAGFMAIGAYTVGILTVDYGWAFWPAFALSGIVAGALGFLGGIISLRLKTHYFSIFTLCVGYIIYLVIEKFDWLTHGTVGIIGLPGPGAIGPLTFTTPVAQYYMLLACLIFSLFVLDRIVHSLFGRACIAIRNDADLAAALGVNVMRTKVIAFVVSTVYAGFAGGLYAGFVRFIGPALASESITFDLVMFLLVGGIGTLSGPLIGTLLLTLATESLQFLQEYRMIVFGPLLIVLIIYFPLGLVGYAKTMLAQRRAPKPSAHPDGKPADA